MSDLQVVATIPAKPEAADAIREALKTLVAATQAEEGCLSYELFESASAPGTFVTVERWTDQAALDAYQNHPQHVALKPFIGATRSTRQCMDFEG